MFRKLLPLLIISALTLAACGGAPAQVSNNSAAASQAVFKTNCGECHGEDGGGTNEAPALAGHTVDQVLKQVRTPEGDMEAISPAKLSDADLALIADFVANLKGEDMHGEDIQPTDEEKVHLMAAYVAIKDHDNMDGQTAIEHLDQADALATGPAARLFEAMIASIKAEKAGNARHELKELLGIMEMGQ